MEISLFVSCILIFSVHFENSASILLPNRPRLKAEDGHLILESAPGKNITLNSKGSGGVTVNGVDIARSYALIESVRPQLETLHLASIEYLVQNLTRVVQNVASEARLSQTLDDFRTRLGTTTQDMDSLKSTVESSLRQLQGLHVNVTELSAVSMTEENKQMLRNVSQMLTQLQINGNTLNGESTGSNLRNIRQKLRILQSRVNDLALLEERVTSLEGSSVNGTMGTPVSATTIYDIRIIKRQIITINQSIRRLMNAVFNDDCSSAPCHHGGTCIDTTTGYVCLCVGGYEGQSCNQDVNECLEFVGTDLGCQNGATCRNSPGSYSCLCTPGWFGIHCTQKTDSCSTSSASEICGHGTCISTPKDGHPYTCLCDQGWTKSSGSPACNQDVNECLSDRPPCSHDPPVLCVNTYGSFRCSYCPQGYEGNGFVCRDIDECQVNNGGCSQIPRVECINTRPGRRCGPCPAGFSGDGITCSPIPRPCSMNPCHYMAVCSDNPEMSSTYFSCQCHFGYTGNGIGPNGCIPTSQAGGGNVAPSQNPCALNPCLHGTCSVVMGNYYCTCQPGYTGHNCNQPVDMCSPSPCLNGGTCTSTLGSFTCDCPSTHTGNLCQTVNRRCGGLLGGHGGTVDYPGGGQAVYQHNISCAWVIRVNDSLVISVNFTSFHLEPAPPACNYDWLQIHDGPRSTARLIGRYCGRDMPGSNGTIVSTHNVMYLWFRSDHSHAGSGFTFTWNATVPECGSVLEGQEHGAINSPGYPGMYPRNRDCYWTIQVSRGKKIQFAFATLQLEHHPNCSFDFLEIKDGLSIDDPALARFCSTQTPAPVVSSASEAFLHFHSDISYQDTGFHITYVAIPGLPGCGGLLTADLGEFSVPTLSTEYTHNLQCEWEIRVPAGEVIQLNFTLFNIENHPSCQWDFVEIRDGGERDSPLVGRYCGNNIPPSFISSRNRLFVYFKSDLSVAYEGFTARYEVACGGEYSALSGTIQSLFYPRPYPHNRICEYVIKLPPGKAIVLNFTEFNVEDSNPTCIWDYLEIRDGLSSRDPLIGRYCGPSHRAPAQIVSTLNGLYLKFKTDASVTSRGFLAAYSGVDIACGGIYHALAGTITFPNAPGSYSENTDCRWVIAMPPGYIVQLTWQSFALEQHTSCDYDYVEVFDNSSIPNTGGRIGNRRFCGSSLPPFITSVDNIITIHFHSDSSSNHDGFSATYHALDASRVCGGNYHTTSGRIQSPYYPQNYPNIRECMWTITVPGNTQIKLNFTSFDLEGFSGSECRYDYLEIRNGGYESSPLLQTLCGHNRTVPDIFSHAHQLYLKFYSDSSDTGGGFEIFWDQISTGCGGTLTSVTGEIMSPGYPQPFHKFADCTWTIRGNYGSKLSLSFLDLDLENVPGCYSNHVEIRDGPRSSSPLIGRYCATQGILSVNSTGNSMNIKFRGGWTDGKRGFRAKYHSDCNTILTKPQGVIESPNFPSEYPHNRNCTWKILAPRGNAINISFSNFEVEDPSFYTSGVCPYDFVELRVGQQNSPLRTVKGHYCGDQIPAPFFSGQGMDTVEVQFVSDFMVSRNGFRLEWVVHGCGGVLTNLRGTFASANYPNAYPANTNCEWHFDAYRGMRIEIVIEEFDIESSFSAQECTFDSLKIYGGRDMTSPVLLTLCHHENSAKTVTTQGNYALMRMESDGSVRGKGFRGRYRMFMGGCGGEFSAPKGEIHSPGYPDNYDNHADCIWKISVDRNHVVEIEFKDFAIEMHYNCSYDYLALYDGDNENAPVLLQHCGGDLPTPAVVRSSGRFMTVRLKADESATRRGFKAEYRMGCGATIDIPLDTGTYAITSPNFPRMFTVFTNCTWHLKALEGYKVKLTFTHLNIEQTRDSMPSNQSCVDDYVLVLDGDTVLSPEVGRYCGTHVPRPFFSTANYLTVQLVTTMGFGVGFRTLYSSVDTACGGELSSLSGEVASPNYPDSYPQSYECLWTISAGAGNRLQLSFSSFDIEVSDGCNLDYLEIHERSPEGALIMHNCSSNIPSPISAVGGFWLKFKSDDQGTAGGFLAIYSIMTSNELSGDRGVIESPLYPHIFTGTREFSWSIILSTWKYISITIEDVNIELNPVQDICFSSLVIHDGATAESPVLRTICGHSPPREAIVSTRNAVLIRFIANFRHEGSSFRLRYETVNNRQTPGIIPVSEDPHQNCSYHVFVNGSSQISSPNYPQNYNNNLRCEWIIQTEADSRLTMFISYELEESLSCIYDSINVFDGIDGTETWNKTHTLCRRDQQVGFIYSTGRFMRITFRTDNSLTRKGFMASFITSCGGVLTDPYGIIKSPNYPSNYPSLARCTWKIKMRLGRTIQFTFNDFRVANQSATCRDDYLLIYNGVDTSSPLLGTGRFCGRSVPTVIETSSNSALLQFRTDGENSDVGFHLSYREISAACGGTLQLTRDVTKITISSPNYPNPPNPHTECVWIILGPPNKPISVHFVDHFDITWSRSCANAYVEVIDGGTQLSRSLGRFCGTGMPNTLTSSDSIILIKYYTNADSVHTGFKAEVETGRCGGVYRLYGGYLSSPNYPEPYDAQSNCSWHAIGLPGHYLTVNFVEVNIYNPSENCSDSTYGKLTVNDTVSNTSVALCSEGQSNPPFDTVSNLASIIFTNNHTGGNINRFKLTIGASSEACGGTVTGSEGYIQSPGYPHGLPHKWRCDWKIQGPPGSKITLQFEDFELPRGRFMNCIGHVQLFNGLEKYSPSLTGRLCGNEIPPPMNSSMNTMRLSFSAYRPRSVRGFKARWTTTQDQECGGTLSESSGVVSSPGMENGGYNHSLFCVWTFHNPNPSNTSMNITIHHLHLELGCFDFILIEGLNPSGEVIASNKICHGEEEVRYIAPYPTTRITFVSDYSINGTGFNISYSPSNCGGYFVGPDNEFRSPQISSASYPANLHCGWLFDYANGAQIEIDFSSFQLEDSENHDFVQIFNGPSTASPLIGRYSGSTSPGHVGPTMSSSVLVVFETDGSNSARGFVATARSHTRGCGGVIHGIRGNISTPGFLDGNNYASNEECIWEIRMESGYQVTTSFVELFDLETSDNCPNDFVQLSTPEDPGTPVKYCGKQIPPPYNANSSVVQVLFRSNNAIEGRGFKMSYSGVCGGIFRNEEGFITSPGYPNTYPPSVVCIYTIDAPEQAFVVLNFTTLAIDMTTRFGCSFGQLLIQQVSSFFGISRMVTRRTLCGTELPSEPIVLRGPVSLNFSSSQYVFPQKGFMLKYSIKACGGNVSESGDIKLPTYPGRYVRLMNCVWDITAPPGQVIHIKFQSLDLEYHTNCNYDYLSIFDGFSNSNDKLIAKFCGNHTDDPPVLTSISSKARLVFNSDVSFSPGHGFRASIQFTYACGGVVNISTSHPSQTIRSLDSNNDGLYEPLLNCRWIITTDTDKVVSFNFTRLDVEGPTANDTQPCPYDFVKIYDGPSETTPLLGEFCGSNLTQRGIVGSRNVMLVIFRSDSLNQTAGFTATVSGVQRQCGAATLTATTTLEVLESPNYPANYPASIRCHWTIVAPENRSIIIHINEFNLQDSPDCSADQLYVGEQAALQTSQSPNPGSRSRPWGGWALNLNGRRAFINYGSTSHSYCGTHFPHHLLLASSQIELRFYSDETQTFPGFRLHYAVATCNTTYTTDSGVLFKEISEVGNCFTTISAENGRFVSLYFSYLHVRSGSSASFKVYDGLDTSAPLLADLSGYTTPSPIFASGSALHIESVEQSIRTVSYSMNYATSELPNGCGGRFFGKRSVVTSPSYPGIPASNLTCVYTIAVSSLYHAAIRMNRLDFGGGGGCNSTYLEVYDVLESNEARLFSKFCEGDNPADHLSPSNRIILNYVTGSAPLTGTGWRAIVMEATPHQDTVFEIQDSSTAAPP